MGRKVVALKLSLLSTFIGEVVSSSTPPLEIINPLTFLFLWGFYGSGVLLVREFWVRWGGNLPSLMLLGVAYGIAEEGLAVKSFFDPNWMDLGKLGEYGRFAGVNFVWAVWLSIFHAVFSISIPILLVHIFHPEYRGKPLLSSRALKILFGLFFVLSAIVFALLNPYPPPPLQYVLAFLAAVLLINRAKKPISINSLPGRNQRNFLYGTFFTLSMFLFFFIVPETPIHPAIPCIAAVYLFVNLFRRFNRTRNDPEGSYRLILGLLSPFLLFFDLISELNGNTGMSVVGILTFAVLLHLSKRLKSSTI